MKFQYNGPAENFGLTMDWNYIQGYVYVQIFNNIDNSLTKFQQKPPKTPQHSPFTFSTFTLTKTGQRQYAQEYDTAELLPLHKLKRCMQLWGCSYITHEQWITNCFLLSKIFTRNKPNLQGKHRNNAKDCYIM